MNWGPIASESDPRLDQAAGGSSMSSVVTSSVSTSA
jgi:hypothetical protein